MVNPAKSVISKSFAKPDERREFKGHGHLDVLNLGGEAIVGRGVFEAGWRWSNDVKPIAGTSSCEAPHLGYCLKGRMTVRMDSGEEFQIKAGDAFQIAPGHDAWVDGNETCEMLDVSGYAEYAVTRKDEKKSA
jgi:hypothetical protein